jgi:hypothetical protein
MLSVVAVSLAAAVGLSVLLAAPPADPSDVAGIVANITLLFLIAASYLVTVFAYAFETHVESRGSCFPYRMFTLPVPTAALALWPMLYGTAALALLWLVMARFLFRPWGVEAPLVWPALLAAVVVAWTQALLWSPFGLPWLRVAVAVPVVTVPVAGTVAGLQLGVPLEWLYAFLAVQLPAAYGVAYAGLAAARRGDAPGWGWLLGCLPRLGARAPVRRGRFATAARAQVWFEWRRHGIKTPVLSALLTSAFLFPLLLGKNPVIPTERTLALAVLAPLLAAGMGINTMGKHNPWVKDYYGVSPFTATRPMSTAALVAAKFKMAFWCAVWAWAVWFALTLPAVFLTDAHHEVREWWERWTQVRPVGEAVGLVFTAGVVLFALTWKKMVENLCINLTGREWVIKGGVAVSLLLFFLVIWVAIAFFSNPVSQETILRALPWVLGAAVAVKAALAVWVVRALLRSGLVPVRTVSTLLGIWWGAAAGLFVLAVRAVPAEYAAPATLAAGVMLSLPLVRLAATPLALAWDRHR